jgi:hypothetical protein
VRSPKQSRRMLAKALRCWRAGRRDGPVTHTGEKLLLTARLAVTVYRPRAVFYTEEP